MPLSNGRHSSGRAFALSSCGRLVALRRTARGAGLAYQREMDCWLSSLTPNAGNPGGQQWRMRVSSRIADRLADVQAGSWLIFWFLSKATH